jgi:hypothetical protein
MIDAKTRVTIQLDLASLTLLIGGLALVHAELDIPVLNGYGEGIKEIRRQDPKLVEEIAHHVQRLFGNFEAVIREHTTDDRSDIAM